MALEMFLNSAMFAALGKVIAVEVHLLKTVVPVQVVETDEVEKVANIVIVFETSGVEEVVMVAESSVAAVMVTEIVAVEAIAGTDLSLEEFVETDAAVAWIPCSVVVGGTVADAVVAVETVAWTAEIAAKVVTLVGPGVAV